MNPTARDARRSPAPPLLGLALGALTMLAGLAAPARGDDAPQLVGQPRGEFRARRQDLMRRVVQASQDNGAGRLMGRLARGGEGEDGPKARPVVVLVGEAAGSEIEGKYRQANNFAYLTGIEAPSAALVLGPGLEDEVLYLPPRDPAAERWTGKLVGPGPEAADALGFARVESTGLFLADVFRLAGDPWKRGTRPPGGGGVMIFTTAPEARGARPVVEPAFTKFLREGAPNTTLRDISPLVHEMRKTKSDAEVALLRKAIAITGEAQAEVVKTIRPGVYEYNLEGSILGAFISGGAMRPGFPSIVGSGINSTVLHYMENRKRVEDGDLVVVDIGAEYKFYTADITRTYPASGTYTPRQREIYQLVLDCQSDAAASFQPGVSTLRTLNDHAKEFFAKSPLRARDEDGQEHTMDHFFIHGLGHHLGMDVHDVSGGPLTLDPGAVFTIEPGLYIPAEALGVRIEDDYLVTKDKTLEKISKDIPCEPDAIERLIARSRSNQATPAGARAAANP